FLNLLAEGIANAPILLLVNYRPEYNHQWSSKTYYTQLRLDPLGKESGGDHESPDWRLTGAGWHVPPAWQKSAAPRGKGPRSGVRLAIPSRTGSQKTGLMSTSLPFLI